MTLKSFVLATTLFALFALLPEANCLHVTRKHDQGHHVKHVAKSVTKKAHTRHAHLLAAEEDEAPRCGVAGNRRRFPCVVESCSEENMRDVDWTTLEEELVQEATALSEGFVYHGIDHMRLSALAARSVPDTCKVFPEDESPAKKLWTRGTMKIAMLAHDIGYANAAMDQGFQPRPPSHESTEKPQIESLKLGAGDKAQRDRHNDELDAGVFEIEPETHEVESIWHLMGKLRCKKFPTSYDRHRLLHIIKMIAATKLGPPGQDMMPGVLEKVLQPYTDKDGVEIDPVKNFCGECSQLKGLLTVEGVMNSGKDRPFEVVARAMDFAWQQPTIIDAFNGEGKVERGQFCNMFAVFSEFQTYGGVRANTMPSEEPLPKGVYEAFTEFLNGQDGFFWFVVSSKIQALKDSQCLLENDKYKSVLKEEGETFGSPDFLNRVAPYVKETKDQLTQLMNNKDDTDNSHTLCDLYNRFKAANPNKFDCTGIHHGIEHGCALESHEG